MLQHNTITQWSPHEGRVTYFSIPTVAIACISLPVVNESECRTTMLFGFQALTKSLH